MFVNSIISYLMIELRGILLTLLSFNHSMFVILSYINLKYVFTNMKINQSATISSHLLAQSQQIGQLVARLRVARKIKQADAAVRAGLSRNTAYRIERGDPGLAIGQVLRYLDAISAGSTLSDLLTESDPSLVALEARERTRRIRDLSSSELKELDF